MTGSQSSNPKTELAEAGYPLNSVFSIKHQSFKGRLFIGNTAMVLNEVEQMGLHNRNIPTPGRFSAMNSRLQAHPTVLQR
jgi:hypothetical protein